MTGDATSTTRAGRWTWCHLARCMGVLCVRVRYGLGEAEVPEAVRRTQEPCLAVVVCLARFAQVRLVIPEAASALRGTHILDG